MSVQLDQAVRDTGTRFLVFPQPRFLVDAPFTKPETVRISVPPEQIEPGPADERMFVVDALEKLPYSLFFRPPYLGPRNEPLKAGPDGHFDHLDADTREFSCATMYATVRRVLDIWEDYLGHRMPWHFETDFARMELIPLIEWNNAQSGYGFLEFGYGKTIDDGIDYSKPYCQNFDVLAHELGHSIVFSEVGIPKSRERRTADYGGMHESFGDLVAIVAALHFNSIVDYLLEKTKGNLFSVNELSRVGELSASRQIRIAFNYYRMPQVGNEPHERSLPLTGAVFDIMVEVFQKELVKCNLIDQDLADRSYHGPGSSQGLSAIQAEFAAAYKDHEAAFKEALLAARDYMGRLLALTWRGLRPPDFLTYHDVVRQIMHADRQLSHGQHEETIRESFAWREITEDSDSIALRPHNLTHCGLS